MKKFAPIFLLLLLLNGCARNSAAPGQTTPPQITSSSSATEAASPSQSPAVNASLPTAKPGPKWRYDLTRDGVYRTDDNTGDVVKINNSESPTGIIITEDWVYYCDDNGQLYRMDNENKKELLVGEKSWPLRLSGNVLYYLSSNGLNRMNVDGSGKEQVFDCDYSGIEMTDTYIFYTLSTPESEELNEQPGADDGPWYLGELHRVGLDGEGDVIVAKLITELSVYQNTVYFTDGDNGSLYSVNPDTLEKATVVESRYIEELYFSDGYAFFIQNRHLFKMSLADGVMTELTNGFWDSCLGILDDYAYVHIDASDPDYSGLYRIRTDGIDLERIYLD